MPRNFFRRVEIAFPVLGAPLRARIFGDLETYLADNVNAWDLRPDGSYQRVQPGSGPLCDAQALLLARYAGTPTPEP